MKNTIWKDFNVPIAEAQRVWVRVPLAILVFPICLSGLIIAGVFDGIHETFKLFIYMVEGKDEQ